MCAVAVTSTAYDGSIKPWQLNRCSAFRTSLKMETSTVHGPQRCNLVLIGDMLTTTSCAVGDKSRQLHSSVMKGPSGSLGSGSCGSWQTPIFLQFFPRRITPTKLELNRASPITHLHSYDEISTPAPITGCFHPIQAIICTNCAFLCATKQTH